MKKIKVKSALEKSETFSSHSGKPKPIYHYGCVTVNCPHCFL